MALPVLPLAAVALRYAAFGLAVYWMLNAKRRPSVDQRMDDTVDAFPDGLEVGRDDRDTLRVFGRMRRVVRFGPTGPGFHVDLAGFARLRMRRV